MIVGGRKGMNKAKRKTIDKNIDSLDPEEVCFFISPIGEPNSEVRERSDKVLRHIVSPAAEESGLVAIRSDQMAMPGMITTQIIRHILNDKMVVADLSDHNANVFYELALRHAFRKPVIQLILSNQPIPFDVQGARTVKYQLDLDSASQARETVSRQMGIVLSQETEVESPVTFAARLEELARSATPENQLIMQTIADQIDGLNKTVLDMSKLICRPEDLKEAIPPLVKDQVGDILRRYAEEIELLKAVRHAGVIGVYKRREIAIKAFSRFIDEESREISIIGSSLKGLLQKEEYQDIKDKLRFKIERGLVKVKFLLTHPIVADFRASQENRGPTEIGHEIIDSLETLKGWNVDCSNVRLYLGTPTCFAIKTTRQMLINPYPYVSVSFDSPCLILEYSPEGGSERPGYFFDEFKSRHFGAWDSDLAVRIKDYDETIKYCREMLPDFAKSVESLLSSGKSFK
jgi:hypothetical protein